MLHRLFPRGLMLLDLEDKDTLAGAAAYTRSIRIDGLGRGGKERSDGTFHPSSHVRLPSM